MLRMQGKQVPFMHSLPLLSGRADIFFFFFSPRLGAWNRSAPPTLPRYYVACDYPISDAIFPGLSQRTSDDPLLKKTKKKTKQKTVTETGRALLKKKKKTCLGHNVATKKNNKKTPNLLQLNPQPSEKIKKYQFHACLQGQIAVPDWGHRA